MECFEIKNLSFTYPNRNKKALDGINITVNEGEFVCIFGKSGCGKTTLLRLLKTVLAPHGEKEGEIKFLNKPLDGYENAEQAQKIGFVLQNVDNQIVTDKVWHELAFGLESLGVPTGEIRIRVAEMASFFGIGEWFNKKVSELSGGQKQLLNLASVMVMQPDVLILDEPTSQLDPIAATEFLRTLEKINKELGTTVILSEHRLEEVFSVSDRVVFMDDGRVIQDGKPNTVGKSMRKTDMFCALPTPMRVYCEVEDKDNSPITVREGKKWLEDYSKKNGLKTELIPDDKVVKTDEICIELKDVWFRYEKDSPDVIKNLNLKVRRGEIFSVLGGNGSGKTTMLSLISGINRPYRGKVLIKDESTGALPQNPQHLFIKNTVFKDLLEMSDEDDVISMAKLCRISHLLEYHPYDLSGGEQQRAALCKVLLKNPQIILLDEPTKGFDAEFKKIFSGILYNLKESGKTVVMVSHDIEFCAEVSDRCAMFFDGNITSLESTRKFFKNNTFYTTSANRMAKKIIPDAVLAEDIILACKKQEMTK